MKDLTKPTKSGTVISGCHSSVGPEEPSVRKLLVSAVVDHGGAVEAHIRE